MFKTFIQKIYKKKQNKSLQERVETLEADLAELSQTCFKLVRRT